MVFLMKKKNKRDNDLYIFICDIYVSYIWKLKKIFVLLKKFFIIYNKYNKTILILNYRYFRT